MFIVVATTCNLTNVTKVAQRVLYKGNALPTPRSVDPELPTFPSPGRALPGLLHQCRQALSILVEEGYLQT